jgi:anti-anti-sigma regulatory factor
MFRVAGRMPSPSGQIRRSPLEMPPRCEVEAIDSGGSVEVILRGAADVASASALQARLREVLPKHKNFTLRLDELSRVDGAGLQLFVAVKASVAGSGRTCTVVLGQGAALRAVETVGAQALLEEGSSCQK